MPIVLSEGITSPITSFSDLSSRSPSNDKEFFGVWIGTAYSLGQDHLCLIRRDVNTPFKSSLRSTSSYHIPGIRQAPVILLYGVDMMVIIPDSPWPVTTGTLFTLILIT